MCNRSYYNAVLIDFFFVSKPITMKCVTRQSMTMINVCNTTLSEKTELYMCVCKTGNSITSVTLFVSYIKICNLMCQRNGKKSFSQTLYSIL